MLVNQQHQMMWCFLPVVFEFGVEFSTWNSVRSFCLAPLLLYASVFIQSSTESTLFWFLFCFYCRCNILDENIYTRCCRAVWQCMCVCGFVCVYILNHSFSYILSTECFTHVFTNTFTNRNFNKFGIKHSFGKFFCYYLTSLNLLYVLLRY